MQANATEIARGILDTDSRSLALLHELLMEERAALAERDTARLDSAVQRKLECLMQLERNEQARRQLVRRNGQAGWPEMLEALDPAMSARWDAIRERLSEVSEMVSVNERIVARSRHNTGRMLAILRGQTEEPDGVYDRKGRASGYGDPRAITSA